MKKNNLLRAIYFFIVYMVTTVILDRLVPGKRMTAKSSITLGLMISTIYFMIITKRSLKEEKDNK